MSSYYIRNIALAIYELFFKREIHLIFIALAGLYHQKKTIRSHMVRNIMIVV
jgi:hypothetical protein